MPHISRYKRRNDDRTGFKWFEIELVKDKQFKVRGTEFDTPPPSKDSLGGRGDVSGEPRANSDFSTTGTANILAENQIPTYVITAGGGITPSYASAWMQIVGSNAAIDITADPQIVRGRQDDVLTLVCVGSNVILDNGTGLNMMGSSQFSMTSGSVICFIYNTGDTAWQETFRSQDGGRI